MRLVMDRERSAAHFGQARTPLCLPRARLLGAREPLQKIVK